jgi:hypothetical protein
MRSAIGTSSATASIRIRPSRNEPDRRRRHVRPAQDHQKLLLGRGRFQQAVMPVDSAGDEKR